MTVELWITVGVIILLADIAWHYLRGSRNSLVQSGRLQTERLSDGRRVLLRDLKVSLPGYPQVCVPKGFITDFSSIPFFFRPFLQWSRVDIAGVVHDYLYWCPQTNIGRIRADCIWFTVAGRGGHCATCLQRGLGWIGLLLGGWYSWGAARRARTAGNDRKCACESDRTPSHDAEMEDRIMGDDNPDPHQQAADALAEARKHVGLDLVVDVVLARMRERKDTQRRAAISLATGVLSAAIAFLGVVVTIFGRGVISNLDILERELEGSRFAEARRAVIGSVPLRFDSELQLNDDRILDVGREQSIRVELIAGPGRYRVDVEAQTEDFDPVVTLYRYRDPTAPPQQVDYNDDGGELLNARLDLEIAPPWNYYLEINEFIGQAGQVSAALRVLSR